MTLSATPRAIQILVVEDNPGDVRLLKEMFKELTSGHCVHVVEDGQDAIAYLERTGQHGDAPRPDVIFLDLNLPRKSGHEVLAHLKADANLRRIPVVVLTTSQSEQDILTSYDLNANCHVTKPGDLEGFMTALRATQNFWLTVASLPTE